MPSSIIEEPRARSAKTVRPPQRPAGSSSVPSTGKAWKGRPAATGGRGTLRQASMARGRARRRCDMRVNPPANLLITGPPGIGKTTVLERVIACLPPAAATGFVTRELRARGVRQGFVIETLDGRSALLASVRFDAGPRVGRYRVGIAALDAVAVPGLAARPGVRLVVVDEIGKMESLSPRFAAAVRAALDSPVPVLGTIARSGGALIAEVRRRPDVTLVGSPACSGFDAPWRTALHVGVAFLSPRDPRAPQRGTRPPRAARAIRLSDAHRLGTP